ncbi:hypothetical protein GN958_ATG19086 [Phytophthora infestans]|uniref:IPT/TIG domain-containing protein n=1 Tax=Phytophthora infestans TaxID=4787 RepID=A0A8S9U0P1_PHYIN|nr:hypothetical protein GN958_ATG19086 [Phytophthora infestans]KAI9997867.1 hypothetical protein PInf_002124 [Phytophthora infestans]
MATNQGCLLSQNGSNVGRAVCVDRGQWSVGGHVLGEAAVNIDEWSFVSVVFSENSTILFVDGAKVEIDVKLESVASSLLVVGAAAEQPLGGITGYLKSVFLLDIALSETELRYLMTAKDVAAQDTHTIAAPTPVEPADKPIPRLYLKDRLENTVSARQVIDPDVDEYNAALLVLDDSELLSVELVYADGTLSDRSIVDGVPFKMWSLGPKQRELHVGSMVTVQGSPSFDALTSMCRINDELTIAPFKVTAHSITCQIPEVDAQARIELSISQNGVSFSSVGEFRLVKRPSIY